MTPHRLLHLGLFIYSFISFLSPCDSQLDVDDFYTFCGNGRARGDNSACLGYCVTPSDASCSAETGICTCKTAGKKNASLSNNYNCKPARPRTRCHNACKTYAMLTPRFRRGDVQVCQSKVENRKMCFCLPKP